MPGAFLVVEGPDGAGKTTLVKRLAARLREAERLGFERAIVPAASARDLDGTSLEVVPVRDLREAIARSGIADQ